MVGKKGVTTTLVWYIVTKIKVCMATDKFPRPIPKVVTTWIQKPKVDLELGLKIVLELKSVGYNVYDSMI